MLPMLPFEVLPSVRARALAVALLAVGLASSAAAGPLPVRVGPTDLHFAWPSAEGSFAGYRVLVSRNGGPFLVEQSVSRSEAWISSQGGEALSLRVAVFDSRGQQGPPTDPSPPVLVLAPTGDADGDGYRNDLDACPLHANDGSDRDADGIPDACDSCPDAPDARGTDVDGDGLGNACDPDADGDGVANTQDLCPYVPLAETLDADQDGVGQRCDPCTTTVWSDPPLNPPDQHTKSSGIIFKHLRTPEAQAIRLEGKFAPASPSAWVQPAATGVSFHVEDADGTIISLGIPAGWQGSSPCDPDDGWKLSYSFGNPIWRYINKSGSVDHESCDLAGATLVTAIVRDKIASRGWIEYVLEFRDLQLDHVPALPARNVLATVSLGDHESRWQPGRAAQAAECGETFLANPADSGLRKPFCKPAFYSGELNKITCRGL